MLRRKFQVPSLQLLEEDELTWAAAEANFAKCARGACFLVLKHAAFVLKVGLRRPQILFLDAQALATKQCMQAHEEKWSSSCMLLRPAAISAAKRAIQSKKQEESRVPRL